MLSEIEASDDKRRMLLKLLLFICYLSQHVGNFLFFLFHLFIYLFIYSGYHIIIIYRSHIGQGQPSYGGLGNGV